MVGRHQWVEAQLRRQQMALWATGILVVITEAAGQGQQTEIVGVLFLAARAQREF
jgi:hypothetical protein